MSTKKQKATSSTNSTQRFTDWSSDPSEEYQYSNDEIVELFGNKFDKPDTNNASCIRHDLIHWREDLDKQFWRRLSSYNSGISNGNWVNDPYFTYILNNHMIHSLLCQLDIKKVHRPKIRSFVMGLDFGRLGRPAELSAFCAIAAHVHGDENIGREYHPSQADEKKDPEFVKVKNDLGLSDSDVLSMISKFNSTNEDQHPSFNYHQFEKRNDYWGL